MAEDPYSSNLLFAGTGNALYVSLDAGEKWVPLQEGLPHAPVAWETVQKQFHDLVVATYGRGIYVLEDITALEQLANGSGDAPVRVFESRPAYRFFHGSQAFVDFWLQSVPKLKVTPRSEDEQADEPQEDAQGEEEGDDQEGQEEEQEGGKQSAKKEEATAGIKVAILDSQGNVVRNLQLVTHKKPGLNPSYKDEYKNGHWARDPDAHVHPGINRVYWDLRYAPPKLIKLRTTPSSNPHVWNDLRFLGKDSRPITHWGIKEAEVGRWRHRAHTPRA